MSEQGSPTSSGSKKIFVIGAILVVAIAIGILAFGGIGKNLVYYWNPTELLANKDKAIGAKIRLGGQVKKGSLPKGYNPSQGSNLNFVVTDGKNDVKVHTTAVPPQMFREGIGVVIEGTYTKQAVFESRRLLVKHDNQYKAPGEGKPADVKKLMKSLAGAEK